MAQTSFWTWACSWPIYLSSIVPLGLLNLSTLDQSVCFWSFNLEIIIPLISKHRIIQMFYNLMPLHPFFNWLCADAHISSAMDRQILYWIIIRQCPPYSITLWAFPRIDNAFGKLYPPLSRPCSTFKLVLITSKRLWYMFLRYPDGLNLCLSKSVWTRKFSRVILLC